MDKPLRILAIVNLPWDPRFGAARVWIEMAAEWSKAGHVVDKFCLTDAFPVPTASPPMAALRLMMFPFRARKFVRRHAERFDVIDALVGTLPFTKNSLRFRGLLVARSVGLFHLYEKFERTAAKRWPPSSNCQRRPARSAWIRPRQACGPQGAASRRVRQAGRNRLRLLPCLRVAPRVDAPAPATGPGCPRSRLPPPAARSDVPRSHSSQKL